MVIRLIAIACFLASAGGTALAHGERHDAKSRKTVVKEQTAFGIAGDPGRASRTIIVDMSDRMRFEPAALVVKRGQTVRFVVNNRGRLMHEMVIGTLPELQEHAALMKKFPDMEHDEPYMAHVKPGATQEIVWLFNRPGEFHYGCLMAGHFEAGMIGTITVK